MIFGKREVIFVLSAVVMEINHTNRTGLWVCNDNILDLTEWQFFMNQPVSECSNL